MERSREITQKLGQILELLHSIDKLILEKNDDIEVQFKDENHPESLHSFVPGSFTRKLLELIEDNVLEGYRPLNIEELTEDDVEFEIECQEEIEPVKGNAIVSGDAEFDKKVENQIIEQLEQGNEWAWCTIRVVAKWKDFFGDDYLGGCSYKSEQDFIESNDYYQDMKTNALAELNKKVKETAGQISALVI